ncbi:MAG: hypothetical protein OHK0017_12160 [Patescibacteria group bacterium]
MQYGQLNSEPVIAGENSKKASIEFEETAALIEIVSEMLLDEKSSEDPVKFFRIHEVLTELCSRKLDHDQIEFLVKVGNTHLETCRDFLQADLASYEVFIDFIPIDFAKDYNFWLSYMLLSSPFKVQNPTIAIPENGLDAVLQIQDFKAPEWLLPYLSEYKQNREVKRSYMEQSWLLRQALRLRSWILNSKNSKEMKLLKEPYKLHSK